MAISYTPQPITTDLIRTVSKASPPDRPREIRDRQERMILRHQPSGVLTIYVQIARGKRERLCDAPRIIDQKDALTLGQVRASARKLLGGHASGRDFAGERKAERAIPTLKDYLDETYSPWIEENRKDKVAPQVIANQFPKFLKLKLNEITRAKVVEWRSAKLKTGVTRDTVNRYVAMLRAALGHAVKEFEIIAANPLLGIREMRIDRNKQVYRALAAAEKEALLNALAARDERKRRERGSANQWRQERGYTPLPQITCFAGPLTPAVVTSLETGLRKGELFDLIWPMVDLEEKIVRVVGEEAKSYQTRDIPLNNTAHIVLRNWWLQCGQPTSGYVFTIDGDRLGDLKRSYHPVLKAAGIARVNAKGQKANFHSLRHTFGTLLGAARIDPTTLMKLMGHADLKTTQRYLHTDADRMREAVDALSGT